MNVVRVPESVVPVEIAEGGFNITGLFHRSVSTVASSLYGTLVVPEELLGPEERAYLSGLQPEVQNIKHYYWTFNTEEDFEAYCRYLPIADEPSPILTFMEEAISRPEEGLTLPRTRDNTAFLMRGSTFRELITAVPPNLFIGHSLPLFWTVNGYYIHLQRDEDMPDEHIRVVDMKEVQPDIS